MLWIFCDWAKLTPKQLLALKDDPASLKAEKLLDQFVADEDFDIPNSVRWNVVNSVRGFFSANYKDLAKRAGKMDLEKVRPYRKPTKEDLRKLYDACYNPRDRSVLVSMPNSTSIAKETLVHLKWKHIEEGWENIEVPHISLPPELIKGHGRGKYKGVRQETFLTPEAKEDLLKYKEWMERVKGVKFTRESNVYFTLQKPYKPLNYEGLGKIALDIAKRAGIEYSLHDARRYVQTALEEAKISSNWARKIRGRKVRGEEAPYSKPEIEKLRAAFKEALPYLMFRSEKVIDEKQRRIQSLIDSARLAGVSEDRIARIKTWATRRFNVITPEEVAEALRKENNEEDPQDCANGEHCERFKQIRESELLPYLQNGWSIVYNLQNGNVIIRKG